MDERIVVALDGSEPATPALDTAVRLASERGARLRAVYVVDLAPLLMAGAEGIDIDALEVARCAAGHEILERAARLAALAGVEVETVLLETPEAGQEVADAIVADAAACRADLIVVGTHGRHGLSRQLLGSVSAAVTHLAAMPVLVVPVATSPAAPAGDRSLTGAAGPPSRG